MTTSVKPGFHIRSEGRPERCEVCHQTDRFNPQTGICSRCQTLPNDFFNSFIAPAGIHLESSQLPERLRNELRHQLDEHEQVLWVSQPFVADAHKTKRLSIAILGMLLFAGFISLFFLFRKGFPVFVGVSLWVGIFCGKMIAPAFEGFAAEKIIYAITNKRLLRISESAARRVKQIPAGTISDIQCSVNEDGSGNVRCFRRHRSRVLPEITFYGVHNARMVESLAREHLLRK
ncbi:MAG: hypothetical protein K1Y36_00585 [Blastocatellia bacterium]|nr:hypothetical protein [Blastocatellia bacterium]